MQMLFYTRLVLYVLTLAVPVIHPAIVVPYDSISFWMWFVLVPAEMFAAFYLFPPKVRKRTAFLSAAAPLVLSVVAIAGFGVESLFYLLVGAAAYVLTVLVFRSRGVGYVVASIEVFVLGSLFYKMLNFSRASEAVALESTGVTQLVLILGAAVFLVHCVVLYQAAFQRTGPRRTARELGLLLVVAVPVVLGITLLLPPDFVSHSVVFNFLKEEPTPELIPIDETGNALRDRGNLLSEEELRQRSGRGGRFGEGELEGESEQQGQDTGGGQKGQNQLRGIPSSRWNDQRFGEQGEGGQQYAVMVVASAAEPVYAAEGYFGELHGERGFLKTRDTYLNDLNSVRLLDTWENATPDLDRKRREFDVSFLSTIPDRVLAYLPHTIEPTVLDRRYHPFIYSYDTVSSISVADPRDWQYIGELTPEERQELGRYLEIPIPDGVLDSFRGYLRLVLKPDQKYYDRIRAIMESFAVYQYEIGFDDDVSIDKMQHFLTTTRTGDCTEFSNTAAILGRIAGIPTRVVTGYLAAEGLQTPAHQQGIRMLVDVLPPLQEYPIQDLYLVTTSHRHSWVQFYLPGYGWVDHDPTTYAIPPQAGPNPSEMDVVIPLIQDIRQEVNPFEFPWRLLARALLVFLGAIIAGLYIARYGQELTTVVLASQNSTRGLRAMQKALLMKLAASGYPLKRRSQTHLEYADDCPDTHGFADTYTTLRYNTHVDSGRSDKLWQTLRTQYRHTVAKSRKRGVIPLIKRIFSLRGLYYT